MPNFIKLGGNDNGSSGKMHIAVKHYIYLLLEQIHLLLPKKFKASAVIHLKCFRSVLTLPSNFKDKQFVQAWNSHIKVKVSKCFQVTNSP